MQEASDNFLAGAGRSGDQNSAAGRCHPLDLLPQLICRRGGANEVDVPSRAKLQLLILAT